MIRQLEILNVYERYPDVKTHVCLDIRPQGDDETDEAYNEYLYDTIHPLTGVGHEDGNSAYFITSTDDLLPVIDEEYGT